MGRIEQIIWGNEWFPCKESLSPVAVILEQARDLVAAKGWSDLTINCVWRLMCLLFPEKCTFMH